MKKYTTPFLAAAAFALLPACSTTCDTASTAPAAAKPACCAKADKGKVCAAKKLPTFNNADFYKNGKFNEDAAKDAYIALMKFYHFPVNAETKAQLWVSDYGTGKFTEVGLGAIMVENNERDRYMIQPLFLLPNQMLPEHWHEKPKGDAPAKMEGWYILGGYTYAVAEGTDNLAQFPEIKVPASHPGKLTARHVNKLGPGQFAKLTKAPDAKKGIAPERHWQFAGKDGAVMIEGGNLHTNSCVVHAVQAINKHFQK
jgi:hypothetical protein